MLRQPPTESWGVPTDAIGQMRSEEDTVTILDTAEGKAMTGLLNSRECELFKMAPPTVGNARARGDFDEDVAPQPAEMAREPADVGSY